jgi:ornithine--oxo-acid transaminase
VKVPGARCFDGDDFYFRDPSGSRNSTFCRRIWPRPELGWRVSVDIKQLIAAREVERYQLHASHLNLQMVHVLKTIGFDKRYQRGIGQYLYDEQDERYLHLLSGWGVFAIGRNHPTVRRALTDVLDSELPNLVQMGVSALSGILAELVVAICSSFRQGIFFQLGH